MGACARACAVCLPSASLSGGMCVLVQSPACQRGSRCGGKQGRTTTNTHTPRRRRARHVVPVFSSQKKTHPTHTNPSTPPLFSTLAPPPRNLRLLLRRRHVSLRLLPRQRRADRRRRPVLLAGGRLQRLPRLQRPRRGAVPRVQGHGAAGGLVGARVSGRVMRKKRRVSLGASLLAARLGVCTLLLFHSFD